MLFNARLVLEETANKQGERKQRDERASQLKLNYLSSLLWHSYEKRKSYFAILVL